METHMSKKFGHLSHHQDQLQFIDIPKVPSACNSKNSASEDQNKNITAPF